MFGAWWRRERRDQLSEEDETLFTIPYFPKTVLIVVATGPGLPEHPLIYRSVGDHTEITFLDDLSEHDDLSEQGLDPGEGYNFRLFSKYSPCCNCARELISTLGGFIENGSEVHISYAQGYYTEFRFQVEEESKNWVTNLEGLENLQNAGFELHPQLDLPPDWRDRGLKIEDPLVFNQLLQVLQS